MKKSWIVLVLPVFALVLFWAGAAYTQGQVYVSPKAATAKKAPKAQKERQALPYVTPQNSQNNNLANPSAAAAQRATALRLEQERLAMRAIDDASKLNPQFVLSNSKEPQNAAQLLQIANARRAGTIVSIMEQREKNRQAFQQSQRQAQPEKTRPALAPIAPLKFPGRSSKPARLFPEP